MGISPIGAGYSPARLLRWTAGAALALTAFILVADATADGDGARASRIHFIPGRDGGVSRTRRVLIRPMDW